jgi:flagellar protein FlgJ
MIPVSASVVDFQAFAELRRGAAEQSPAALKEAAQQFESLIIGMMLKSARDAQLGDGLFDSSQSKQYLELMDQQVALELARKGGFGFGDMIIEQLSAVQPAVDSFEPSSPEEFVRELLPEARQAAAKLGVAPEVLLAQAALESAWGGATPRHIDGSSSNNLFGIKAGGSWRGSSVAQWTLESMDGAMSRQREQFRAYPSAGQSFSDYAALISQNSRYAAALESGGDPERYVREVAGAGYATDPEYAQKWLSVFNGQTLRDAVAAAQVNSAGADTAAVVNGKSENVY